MGSLDSLLDPILYCQPGNRMKLLLTIISSNRARFNEEARKLKIPIQIRCLRVSSVIPEATICAWSTNVGGFMSDGSSSLQFHKRDLTSIYAGFITLNEEVGEQDDIVRYRFVSLFFYDLQRAIITAIRRDSNHNLADLIHFESHTTSQIRANIQRAISAGLRYDWLAARFGPGILIDLGGLQKTKLKRLSVRNPESLPKEFAEINVRACSNDLGYKIRSYCSGAFKQSVEKAQQDATTEGAVSMQQSIAQQQELECNIVTTFTGPKSDSNGPSRLYYEDPIKPIVLLLILHSLPKLENKLERQLLWAFGCPRKQWNDQGEVYSFTAMERGVSSATASLFSHKDELDAIIEKLASLEVLDIEADKIKMRADGLWFIHIFDRNLLDLMHQDALLLLCYCFSGCSLTARYAEFGRLALPYFSGLCNASQKHMDSKHQHFLDTYKCEALLGSSEFGTSDWKRQAVSLAEGLRPRDEDQQIRLSIRMAVVSQNLDTPPAYPDSIDSFLNMLNQRMDRSHNSNGWLGLLINAKALWTFRRGDPKRALDILSDWKCLDEHKISLRELSVVRKISMSKGRILMAVGDLDEAICKFQGVLGTYTMAREPNQTCSMKSCLMDAYCEMGDLAGALGLKPAELGSFSCLSQPWNRAWRAINTSYAEVLLCEKDLLRAQVVIHDVLASYEVAPNKTRQDHWRQLRGLIVDARIHHLSGYRWQDAIKSWTRVQEFNSKYNLITQFDREHAIILFSAEDALFRLQKRPDADIRLIERITKLPKDGLHSIPGLRFSWLAQLLLRSGYPSSAIQQLLLRLGYPSSAIRPLLQPNTDHQSRVPSLGLLMN